jgi:hypothetical protein
VCGGVHGAVILFYAATTDALPDDGPVRSETCRSVVF